jgi:hypothetical protein
MTESAEAAPKPEDAEANHEELREYLECWRLPAGRLAPDQLRALLAWSGTPEEEKAGLRESLALTRQQVPTRSLAPDQRRGHVSWVERLKGVFRP